jgi:hypothetical protein
MSAGDGMNFLKTTLLGGIAFLIPISIFVLIVGKAYKAMLKLSAPPANWVTMDRACWNYNGNAWLSSFGACKTRRDLMHTEKEF